MVDPSRLSLPLDVVAFGVTDVGRARVHNEDAVLLRPELGLFILADGAGGHNAGNVASALATTAIANHIEAVSKQPLDAVDPFGTPRAVRHLAAALQRANADILEIARASNKWKGMGTTAVAVLFRPNTGRLHVAHVGDSRLYRLRDGILEQLTVDHSLLTDALELRPDADDAVLARLPRNVVTRALGMDAQVRVTSNTHRALAGDRYLLCSDGLTDVLSDEGIAERLGADVPLPDVVRLLVDDANELGTRDNVGVVVLECRLGEGARADAGPPPQRQRMTSLPELGPTHDSNPEIVILGVAELVAEKSPTGGHSIVVVPAESAEPELIVAIEEIVRPSMIPPAGDEE
jgi:protein phosphatase